MDDIENNEYKFYNYDIENIRDIFFMLIRYNVFIF